MVKDKLSKKKLEDVTLEDVKDIKEDSRTDQALGGIMKFKKVACKKCNRRLNLFIPKLLVMRKTNIEKWVEEKICDECKKFLI